MSPAKQAAVKARLKRVRPKNPGGGGGTSKALTKTTTTTVSNPGTKNNNNRRPRGGATYQAVKVTAQAAVPLTDYVSAKGPKSVNALMAHLRSRATPELGKGYIVAAADFGLSKSRFVRHANALSRLSVTALAPEAYLALKAVEDVQAKVPAREIHNRASVATMGFAPTQNTFMPTNQRFRTYHKIKWIGAGLRLIANRTRIGRAITRPIRENVLKELGGSV